ncbi:MAG: septum formation initiator family protein [Acidobacteriota bacterium]
MQFTIPAETRRRAKRYLWIAVCSLALLSLAVHEIAGENGYLVRRQRRLQMQALDEEVQRLQEDNRRLTQKIQLLRSDPQTIEELAREKLRLARPGEVVVTLPPEEQPDAPSLNGDPPR